MLGFISDCVFVGSKVKTRFVYSSTSTITSARFNLWVFYYVFVVIFHGCFSIRLLNYTKYTNGFYFRVFSLGFDLPIKLSCATFYIYRVYLICKRILKVGVFYVCNYYCKGDCGICFGISIFERLYLLKKLRCGLYKVSRFVVLSNFNYHGALQCKLFKYAIINNYVNGNIVFDRLFYKVLCDRIEKHTWVFFNNHMCDSYLYCWFLWLYNFIYKKYLYVNNYSFTTLCYFCNFRSVSHLLNLRVWARYTDPYIFTVQGCLNRALSVVSIKKLACCWFLISAPFYSFSFLKWILLAFLLIEEYYTVYLLVGFLKLLIVNLCIYNIFYIDNCISFICVTYRVIIGVSLLCFFLRLLSIKLIVTYGDFYAKCSTSSILVIPAVFIHHAKVFLYNTSGVTVFNCKFFLPFSFAFYIVKVRAIGLGFFCLYNILGRYIFKEILLVRSIL
ncbi:hypothetical protein ACWNX2_00225 [Candidatus Vidania fulgoroideorum]